MRATEIRKNDLMGVAACIQLQLTYDPGVRSQFVTTAQRVCPNTCSHWPVESRATNSSHGLIHTQESTTLTASTTSALHMIHLSRLQGVNVNTNKVASGHIYSRVFAHCRLDLCRHLISSYLPNSALTHSHRSLSKGSLYALCIFTTPTSAG